MKVAAAIVVIAIAFPALGRTQTPAPAPALEDVVVSLVLNNCLPETLQRTLIPPAGRALADQNIPGLSRHNLSRAAIRTPTRSGMVIYDHYAGYCRIVALPADGDAIRDRLIQALGARNRDYSTWRYPDLRRTRVDRMHLTLDNMRRGYCTPIIDIDSARSGDRWIDISVGWALDGKVIKIMGPEACRQR